MKFGKRCPNCNGILIKIPDKEFRLWWTCADCGIQIPVKAKRI